MAESPRSLQKDAYTRWKKIPFISPILIWFYRLFKLPMRFHKLNDLFSILFSQTQKMQDQVHQLTFKTSELHDRVVSVARDLELLHRELQQKAGLSKEIVARELALTEMSSNSYMYLAFENQFRGSKQSIRENQIQYIAAIVESSQSVAGKYFLDLGCGRGEFLKLLGEHNVPARGVDMTKAMVDSCHNDGLDATLMDSLEFLRKVEDHSLIGLSAFQVVEHLSVDYLLELLKIAFTKLAKGGIIILETVNSDSLTSLKNFYLDLSHRNPIPPAALKFLIDHLGFKNSKIHYSSPLPEHFRLKGQDENTLKLNELLFACQDYAVIAWR